MRRRILVWDMPTRALHWLLALSFAGALLSAESDVPAAGFSTALSNADDLAALSRHADHDEDYWCAL